jgi:NAD(P)H-dependent FMN reductase
MTTIVGIAGSLRRTALTSVVAREAPATAFGGRTR